jgi:MinD superfamily P-loop ATPase
VLADCDVDAADLHLILRPDVICRTEFISGHEAVIRQADCTACGTCMAKCRFEAVHQNGGAPGNPVFSIDPASCEGCGVCVRLCPVHAIDFRERICGEWYISNTRFGPLVHAKLGIAAENSGKLVSLVRNEAKRIAEESGRSLIIVDGPPGIGCPVIASVTGASLVLVVTEPTLSGQHDMKRVLDLARFFKIPAMVCVNRWDINPALAEEIEKKVMESGAEITPRILYDRSVTDAQVKGQTVVEYSNGIAAKNMKEVWETICRKIL